MLNDLTDLQESNEDIWGAAEVSFTIRTREPVDNKIFEREYTFTNAPEFGKWLFTEFDEKWTKDTEMVTARDWRRSRRIMWHEDDSHEVEVPPEVTRKLEELLGLEEITIQTP